MSVAMVVALVVDGDVVAAVPSRSFADFCRCAEACACASCGRRSALDWTVTSNNKDMFLIIHLRYLISGMCICAGARDR